MEYKSCKGELQFAPTIRPNDSPQRFAPTIRPNDSPQRIALINNNKK